MGNTTDRGFNIIRIICYACLALVIFFILLVNPNAPKEEDLKKNIPASVLKKTEIQYVYTPPESNDESDAVVVNKDTVSYWYVYYTANIPTDHRYDGYKVVKITKPYFDIDLAVKQILPSYVDDEYHYVGIEFFKRVPFETYESYMKNDGE